MNQMNAQQTSIPQHLPSTHFIGTTTRGKTRSNAKINPAKRLAETKKLGQAEWLEIRRQGIGSSDCAAACGLNPYMSMLELWMIKTGRIKQNI